MSDDDTPLPEYLTGYVRLRPAIERAACALGCSPAQAWEKLRPLLAGEVIRSKLDYDYPVRLYPEEWLNSENDRSYEDGQHGHYGGVRFPAVVSNRDLTSFLKEVAPPKSGSSDETILTRLFDTVSGQASMVPISELILSMDVGERAEFEVSLVKAIRAGLFDGKGLEVLCDGDWAPLGSVDFTKIEKHFDKMTVRNTYVLKSALPLSELSRWARKYQPSLYKILRPGGVLVGCPSHDGDAGHDTAATNNVDGDPAKQVDTSSSLATWQKKRGRGFLYNWSGLFRHLLDLHDQAPPLSREDAERAADEFFRQRGNYPSKLKDKIRDLYKAVTPDRNLRELLDEKSKE